MHWVCLWFIISSNSNFRFMRAICETFMINFSCCMYISDVFCNTIMLVLTGLYYYFCEVLLTKKNRNMGNREFNIIKNFVDAIFGGFSATAASAATFSFCSGFCLPEVVIANVDSSYDGTFTEFNSTLYATELSNVHSFDAGVECNFSKYVYVFIINYLNLRFCFSTNT